mgnify:CR=1 FL=1|tara:strand:- start:224 stop:616 length:393 start_codon:yes stop_codon:yes gene_type:complete
MFNTSNSLTLSVPDTRWYLDSIQSGNYPPYNIISKDNNVYLELAVAGFKQDELKVYTEEGILHVEGDREETYDENLFIYRGLGFRKFHKKWKITDGVEVVEVKHEDGLIKVHLQKIIPEGHRRKDYLISN